jgi:hypothetical protein
MTTHLTYLSQLHQAEAVRCPVFEKWEKAYLPDPWEIWDFRF